MKPHRNKTNAAYGFSANPSSHDFSLRMGYKSFSFIGRPEIHRTGHGDLPTFGIQAGNEAQSAYDKKGSKEKTLSTKGTKTTNWKEEAKGQSTFVVLSVFRGKYWRIHYSSYKRWRAESTTPHATPTLSDSPAPYLRMHIFTSASCFT